MAQLPNNKQPTLRVRTVPNDANQSGDIFGGWLMSQIDVSGAIVAIERARGSVVTVAVKELLFLKPIYVYDVVNFYSEVVDVGTTSITVKTEAYVQRYDDFSNIEKVSDATLVYVAVEKPGQKRKVPA